MCVKVVPRKLYEHSKASLLLVCCCSFVTYSFPETHGQNVMSDYIVEDLGLAFKCFFFFLFEVVS